LDFRIWDGLAYCYSKISKFKEASHAGKQSLDLKDKKVSAASSSFVLPHQSPPGHCQAKKECDFL